MSRPPGGNSGGDATRSGPVGAGSAMVKGALLIGLAVIIGIVLLQTIDSPKSNSGAATTPTTKPKPKTTTTVKRSGATTTTTTVAAPTAPVKSPDQLRIIVLNGGAPTGDASKMSTTLKQKGYTNQATANDWKSHKQQGNTVLCRAGLDREGTTLATAVGGGSPVPLQPFPTPTPPLSDGPPPVDCTVVVGA